MAEIKVQDIDYTSLKGSVVIVTGRLYISTISPLLCRTNSVLGGSSGIGLATVKLLLEHGATVVNGDLRAPDFTHPALTFRRTDVNSWKDLTSLFKTTKQVHSSIDHVFANAGIVSTSDYLDENLDEAGDLLEPTSSTIDINLKAVINTATLAMHHMRTQPNFGSIVITGSASSFQPLCSVEYTAAKHGVLGFMRGMKSMLEVAGLPIRINTISPSWTDTAILPAKAIEAFGGLMQTADDVAPSAALLMADKARNGHLVYSEAGRLWEIEETVLLPAALSVRIPGTQTLDETLVMMSKAAMAEGAKKAAEKA